MDIAKNVYKISVEDYLEGEKESSIKHEYIHGEVWAMSGASSVHGIITMSLSLVLAPVVRKKGCNVYAGDMKVKANDAIYYYPDFVISCEKQADDYFLKSPCVVIEVISKSTARTDQNEKLYAYQAIKELQLYLLVDSRKQAITGYYKTKQGWEKRVFSEQDTVSIPCAEVELSFEDIYTQTEYAPSF